MQQQTFAVTVKLWQVVFCDARDSEVATIQNPKGQRKGRNNVAKPKFRPGSKNVFGKFKNILLSRCIGFTLRQGAEEETFGKH